MRMRLTVLLIVLAALAGAAATVFGTSVIRDRVLDGLVDDQVAAAEFVLAFSEELQAEQAQFENQGSIVVTPDGALVDGVLVDDVVVDDGEFELDGFESFAFSLESQAAFAYAVALDDGAEAFLDLLDVLDVVPGDPLPVLLDDGRVGSITPSFDQTSGGMGPVDDGPIVPAWSLYAFEAGAFLAEDLEVFGDRSEFGVPELSSPSFSIVERTVSDRQIVFVIEESDVLGSLDEVRAGLWVATALLAVLAGAATWFLLGRALRPVARITAQADTISAGTLHERVPVPGAKDEIHGLATTVNRMLDRLELGDRRRRQFVSDASHELRSPVAVLRTEAEVALRHPATTEVPELAGVVLGEAERLSVIVEDLLTLARRDEGREVGGVVEVDLDDLVLAEANRARRVPVARSQVSAGRVLGRRDDLQRTIAHLLDNATRHANEQVEVGLHTDDDGVWLWVDDDGAGVSERDRSRIFERFTRLDEARTRDAGGSGLGLAVVAETVRELGGEVTVGDSPLGGARFEVRLPAIVG